ncbi:MAG: hypothetical protein AB1778_04905 [Candidatus Bipolaricaulota bacterium]
MRRIRVPYLSASGGWLFFLLCVALVSPRAAGSPSVALAFGFDGQFVRYHYAPASVTVTGLDRPTAARLLIKQILDTRSTPPRVAVHEIFRGTVSNATYSATVPAYDAVLPVLVQLVHEDGTVLASTTQPARQSARGLPLVVIAGAPLHFDGSEAVVSPTSLPSDAWAYDGVASVWLTSPLTSRAAWMALGAWVSAGGSLVIFSGEDFYQWDCAAARHLLPLDDPVVLSSVDQPSFLSGIPRPGARVLLSARGQPLLVRTPYGAGQVSLVTLRVRDLAAAELARLNVHVPRARPLLAAQSLAETLLNETRVLRPPYGFVPAILGALLAGVVLAGRFARKHARLAGLAAVLGVFLLSVACSFYVNLATTVAYQYSTETTLRITTSFGFSTVSYCFFALTSSVVYVNHEKGAFPVQAGVPTSVDRVYAMESALDATTLALPGGTRPVLRAHGRAPAGLSLEVADSESVTTYCVRRLLGQTLSACLLVVDGFYYRVPRDALDVPVRLVDLTQVSASALDGRETLLYRLVADWIGEMPDAWLVALSEEESIASDLPGRAKVRLADVDLVTGGRS